MSAYSLRLKIQCDRCARRATHEVRNTYNASQGKFCARHAKALVAELQAAEQRAAQAPAAETEAS